MFKICNKCFTEKSKEKFRVCKYRNGSPYLKSCCIECERSNSLKYAKTHKNERKEYSKQYLISNPNYIKNYKCKNKEIIRKKERDRRKQDICFKLRKNVSRAINHTINKNFSNKKSSIMQFLPYSMKDLKEHLQNQFDQHMSWNNYGTYWQIDHIIPQSDLPFSLMSEENFKICWDLKNLRPLNRIQNMLDGSTRVRHRKMN